MALPSEQQQRMVAAIDLGSNSFHMVVARVAGRQFHVVDRLKEMVRLAAGLDEQRELDPEARDRALACLQRFGQRLRSLSIVQVRVVGTNTLRRMRSQRAFLEAAEQALGYPIEIIYGVEEARLIYAGVTLDMGVARPRRIVVDIGGGSTEIIIGNKDVPILMESISMGAISFSQRHFPAGQVTQAGWDDAVLRACAHLAPIVSRFCAADRDIALGASGSIKAIARIAKAGGWSGGEITPSVLKKLQKALIKAGHVDRVVLPGLSEARRPILPGAVAVLAALFESLEIQTMHVSDKALREGILVDMLGTSERGNPRQATVTAMQQRYSVDAQQADRVADTVRHLLAQAGDWAATDNPWPDTLYWACQLHEIGLAIAHKGYHRHGAYIVHHADLHGFSQSQQLIMAVLLGLQRGKLCRDVLADIPARQRLEVERQVLLLRLAVLLHRGRDLTGDVPVQLGVNKKALRLSFGDGWLAAHPLTQVELTREQDHLAAAGYTLDI